MSIYKDLFIEALEELEDEAPDMPEREREDLAMERAGDHFADMCDRARDAAKYKDYE